MKKPLPDKLEAGRIRQGHYASNTGDTFGTFIIRGPCGEKPIMACDGGPAQSDGWDHVSVSTPCRIPNWTEMSFIKNLFWDDEDTVICGRKPIAVMRAGSLYQPASSMKS